MPRTSLTASMSFILLISISLLSSSHALSTDRVVISDDGREVLLKDDGSWEFLSDDRFANTDDGQRVRLKHDGSWEYMGNVPMTSSVQVRTKELDIKLDSVVIETHEVKVQKNKRVDSQTVFYLNLELSPLAKKDVIISKNDVPLIEVKDNKGRRYPVLSIQPSPETLKPGSNTTLSIRVDGSPQWWKNVKIMDISLKPGMLGLQETTTLRQNVDDIVNKKVDGFE